MGRLTERTFLIIVIACLIGCGGSSSSSGSGSSNQINQDNDDVDDTDDDESVGDQVTFSFDFYSSMDAEDDDYDFTMLPFLETYEMPMYVDADGNLILLGSEFPRLIYTIPAEMSELDFDIDMVIDAGGEEDTEIYTGTLSATGAVSFSDIQIRLRFVIITDSVDGESLPDDSPGTLGELDRMPMDVSTDTMSQGSLSYTGSPIANLTCALVATGVLPEDIPIIGGADALSVLVGTFDTDPRDYL